VTTDERPTGKQYRATYKTQTDPALDSGYFRVRLYSLLETYEIPMSNADLLRLFTQSMAIRGGAFDSVLQNAPIERLLSFVTVLYGALIERATHTSFRNNYDEMLAKRAPAKLCAGVARCNYSIRRPPYATYSMQPNRCSS
jgi:hypothetical protein